MSRKNLKTAAVTVVLAEFFLLSAITMIWLVSEQMIPFLYSLAVTEWFIQAVVQLSIYGIVLLEMGILLLIIKHVLGRITDETNTIQKGGRI